MIKIKQAVIVEGKYDKIKVSSVIDSLIIETEGFGIFKDREKQKLIRRLALERGLVILTDSDSAGFTIRSFLNGIAPPDTITNVYIPDVFGKEKRKNAVSKEGKIGVEGMKTQIIEEALRKAGVEADFSHRDETRRLVTKTDFFCDGLSGQKDSAEFRRLFLKQLDLPEHMSANSLLKLINSFMDYEDYQKEIDLLKRRVREE